MALTPQKARSSPRTPPNSASTHALGEELAQQPAARGSQGRADGDLLLPRLGPRQQQVGHVDAGDQQHQARPRP